MRRLFIKGAVVAASVVLSAATARPASAQFLLNFGGGSANVRNDPADVSGNTLLIDFLNEATQVVTPTTTLPGVALGTPVTLHDVSVTASGCATATASDPCPIPGFILVGGYTFNLLSTPPQPGGGPVLSFGPVQLIGGPTGTTATLAVAGTVTGPGFTGTRTFNGLFSAQFSGETPTQVFNSVNSGGTRNVSFSAEVNTNTVPEPASIVLMGSGLLGLITVARRRREA